MATIAIQRLYEVIKGICENCGEYDKTESAVEGLRLTKNGMAIILRLYVEEGELSYEFEDFGDDDHAARIDTRMRQAYRDAFGNNVPTFREKRRAKRQTRRQTKYRREK
jgi:hypothetical protein